MPAKTQIRIGVFFYLFIIFVAFGVQFVALPFLFPSIHWGHGLVLGDDSIGVHKKAVMQVSEIRRDGWSRWSGVKPGLPMVGLTAAIYTLTISEPCMLIPVQAFFYAGTLLLLTNLAFLFLENTLLSVVAVSPAFIFLTPVGVYGSLMKDGMFDLGCGLFILAMVFLLEKWTEKNRISVLLLTSAMLITSCALVELTRPYVLHLLLLIALLVGISKLSFCGPPHRRIFPNSFPFC